MATGSCRPRPRLRRITEQDFRPGSAAHPTSIDAQPGVLVPDLDPPEAHAASPDAGSFTLARAPGGIPALGHALRIWRAPLDFMSSLPAYGDLVRIEVGPRHIHVACHPDLAQQVMRAADTFDKGGIGIEMIKEAVGDGILTCPRSEHRRIRRMVQPAFRQARLAGYSAAMVEAADAMTRSWRSGMPVDVTRQMYEVSTAIAVRTMFASQMSEHRGEEARRCVNVAVRGIRQQAVASSLGLTWLFPVRRHQFRRAVTRYRTLVEETVLAYRREGVDRGDILSMLLSARDDSGASMSDREVRDNVMGLFLAGVDGAAGPLVWTLHLLDSHPQFARRVHAEIDAVLDGAPPVHETVQRLDFTRRAVLEALRLYPSSWIIPRVLTSEADLAGWKLPAGACVAFSPYQMHRRPDLFPEPERFDPDRWLGGTPGPKGAYIPFGGGARKCIGDAFGLLEVVVVLARVLQDWELRGPGSGPLTPLVDTLLRPPSLLMTVRRRRGLG